MKVVNEKAVELARDVLAHLDTLRLHKQTYGVGDLYGLTVDGKADLGNFADQITKNCHMCLLGALLLSKARRYDNVQAAEYLTKIEHPGNDRYFYEVPRCRIDEQLGTIFSRHELAKLESAFMTHRMFDTGAVTSAGEADELLAAMSFGQQYADPTDRVRAVMQNVIDNGGTFVVNVKQLEPFCSTAAGPIRSSRPSARQS